jgi:RNA polymerase sigma-70 factor, ECF subfamily
MPHTEGESGFPQELGDPKDALTEVLRTHGARVLAAARQLLPDENEARDAFQEGMLAAWKALPEFEGRARLSTWVHRIVVNHALMRLRQKRRRDEQSIEDFLPTYTAYGHHCRSQTEWSEEPESLLERAETRSLVNENIARLPETYRVPLVLLEIQGMEVSEVASVLDVTPNAVRIRVHRARQALKALLEPLLIEQAS